LNTTWLSEAIDRGWILPEVQEAIREILAHPTREEKEVERASNKLADRIVRHLIQRVRRRMVEQHTEALNRLKATVVDAIEREREEVL